MRIGSGLDVHAFSAGDHIMLGGVRIPHHKGLAAHSDGDVLLHAVIDALLGAAGGGDIGEWFPPSDDQWKGVDSRKMLARVMGFIQENAWQIENLDVTLVCEQPRLKQWKPLIRKQLALDLLLEENRVNVKATTTEKLGFTGREEGILAQVVVLLRPQT